MELGPRPRQVTAAAAAATGLKLMCRGVIAATADNFCSRAPHKRLV